jgi:hypothetical protein
MDDQRWHEELTGDGWECAHCGEWKAESLFDDGSIVCRACEDPGAALEEGFEAALADDEDGAA